MSLRKSPRLTPALLVAAGKNAQHFTGPRTPAGKQNSRLNALKRGRYAMLENHHSADPRLCKIALGDDPHLENTGKTPGIDNPSGTPAMEQA